jgi:PAS domain S-box-containing protein
LTALSNRATTTVEQAVVACLHMDVCTTLDQSSRAVDVCLHYLRHVGIEWSPHPEDEEVRREYERIWSLLGSRTIEDLIDLPLMEDAASLATVEVLSKLFAPANFTDANLASLTMCKAASLSLERGNCDASCIAYVMFGRITGACFGDYQAGFRFGQLGYELVERRGLKRFEAITYLCFATFVVRWTKHVRASRDLLRRAFDAANRIGDLTSGAYTCNNLNSDLLFAGEPLPEVQGEAEQGLAFAEKARFGLVIDIITTQLALIRMLRGLTLKFGCFDDGQFNELHVEYHLSSNPALAIAACWYWVRKLQARYIAGDYAAAMDATSKAQRLLWTSPSHFEVAEYHFYGALTRAACYCDSAPSDEREQHLDALAAHHRQLQVWAENYPENFENRAALVGAEIARVEGRALDAMELYEQAIRSARAKGFVHNEALANELAARFYAARGFEKIAQAYVQGARYGYLRWGADGKVRQLDEYYPHLHQERDSTSSTPTIGRPVRQLDVETVVKASQALSSEIALPKLIENLVRIAVEHAGAERGLLILLRGDEPQIEAEATTGHGRPTVTLRRTAVTPSDLPQSALHYVIRTRERVLLDDASVENLYSEDEYLRQRRPRSVLCLPIVKQTKLVGALYLENTLTPHAFTSDRVTVLELLASQAAISLENAGLYSDLQRSEAFLTEGQSISHTGSFGWSVASGEIYWSAETYNIFEHDRTVKPTLELILPRIHPDDRDLVRQTLDRACEAKADFDLEHRLLMPVGSVKHLHVLARALTNSSGNLEFVGAVTDITAAKQAEEALRRSEAYLAEAQRLTHTGSWVWNVRTEALFWSQEVFRIYDCDPEMTPTWDFLLQRVHPEDRAAFERRKKMEFTEKEWTDSKIDFRIVLPDGTIKHLHSIGHPVMDKSGEFTEVVGTVIDVTERKRAEEERDRLHQLEAELAHINRMSMMGELTASIAHEVNQPLSGIVSNASACLRWLAADLPNLEEVREANRDIVRDGKRAGEVIAGIRALTRGATVPKERLDLNDTIREVLALVRDEARRNSVFIRTQLANNLSSVAGNRVQLQQIVLNLVMNAIEAMNGIGDRSRELVITTRNVDPDHVQATLEDSGKGLDPKTIDKIFKSFYTTKPGGMGMGLSISRSIVQVHGGQLWATANDGPGASFHFTVPRYHHEGADERVGGL